MILPTYFNVSPENQTGEVYGTEFTFSANLPPEYIKYAWDFGDNSGIVYNSSDVTHTYKYPGIWTVQLSSWTGRGNIYVDQATIDVDYVYRDSILFTQIPESYGIPGLSSIKAFTVSVTSAKIDQELSIVLQSFNSKSVPRYSIPEKWSFITPNWRFTEEDGTVLEGPLVLDSIPVYNSSNKIVAVKAEKNFFYIDDLSTGLDPEKDCPLMLVATLSTERFYYPLESLIYPYASYSNSEVTRAVISWQINDVIPTNLKVTENFINPIYPIKWANVPIPVMVTLESDSNLQPNFSSTSGEQNYVTTALSYPRTNELGRGNEVVLSLSSNVFPHLSAGIHYKVADSPLYFKATDDYGNVASGYIFTTIIPLTSFIGKVAINASTIVVAQADGSGFTFPIGYPIQPNVYVSHPAKNSINRLNVFNAPANCEALNKYRSLGILVEGALTFVPPSSGNSSYSLSSSNVYALTFNPNVNRLYTADIELNTISYYSEGLYLNKTVDLESIFNKTSLGPSYISVDRNNNVWVSLFDDRAILKFDASLNLILSAIPTASYHIIVEPQLTEEEFLLNEDFTFLDIQSVYEESIELHPPIVETDREDNVWVCYPGDGTSTLFKFDTNGETILQAGQLSPISYPVSLSIDADNYVWVACKNTHELMRFSPEGILDKTVSGLIYPSYIAHDRSGNVCILHGFDIFSIYNTSTDELSSWRIDVEGGSAGKGIVVPITEYTQQDFTIFRTQEIDEIWGGLCVDVYNRVWIIDSNKNKVMSFKPYNVENFAVNSIVPTGNYKKYFTTNDSINAPLSSVDVNQIRSAQAGGDWSGNRWYQKYGSGSGGTMPIKGTSSLFEIKNLNDSYTIGKVNNDFNYSEHFKSLVLPEFFQQNSSLFTFLSAVGGDSNPTTESAGRVVYEKIANFVGNKSDVDTAEVDSLLCMAEQMGVEYKEFGTNFPVNVNNYLSLFSIPKQYLRGNINYETDISKNIGNVITEFDMITADRYYLARDKRTNKDLLIWVDKFAGQVVYPSVNFISNSLRTPVLDHYSVFEYNVDNINAENPYFGNIIDWENQFTTLLYNISSEEEWYGDAGIIENAFNNLLTKQLYQQ